MLNLKKAEASGRLAGLRPRSGAGLFPRRYWVAGAVLLVALVSVLTDLSSHSSPSQEAQDLQTFHGQVATDLESCNASVGDAFAAYTAVEHGQSSERSTAIRLAQGNQPYCTPDVNSDLLDLSGVEVPASLRNLGLQRALSDVNAWAFPQASSAIGDIQRLLSNQSDTTARDDLRLRVTTLKRLAVSANASFGAAASHLHTHLNGLNLNAPDRLRAAF